MPQTHTGDRGFGVTCIDAQYMKPGIACFYLLEQAGEYAVIETGTVHSVPLLEQVLSAKGVSPEQVRYVIPTHVHLDHAGGAGRMMERFGEATLLAHPRAAPHLVEPDRLIAGSQAVYGEVLFEKLYGEIVPVDENRLLEVEDGGVFSLGDRTLLFRHTRGHADHHFCIWDDVSRGWFSGDMFGVSYQRFRTPGGDFVIPTTTPTQFRPAEFLDSLELLAEQKPERIWLTHFDELPYSEATRQLLARQVEAYARLALEHSGDPSAMEHAIAEYSMVCLEDMNPGADMSYMREHLQLDARLNAQGLAVWYQRQAR